jgi:hypothetical protein
MNELHFIFQVVMSDRILLKIAKSVGNFKNEPNLITNHASADEGMIPEGKRMQIIELIDDQNLFYFKTASILN